MTNNKIDLNCSWNIMAPFYYQIIITSMNLWLCILSEPLFTYMHAYLPKFLAAMIHYQHSLVSNYRHSCHFMLFNISPPLDYVVVLLLYLIYDYECCWITGLMFILYIPRPWARWGWQAFRFQDHLGAFGARGVWSCTYRCALKQKNCSLCLGC